MNPKRLMAGFSDLYAWAKHKLRRKKLNKSQVRTTRQPMNPIPPTEVVTATADL